MNKKICWVGHFWDEWGPAINVVGDQWIAMFSTSNWPPELLYIHDRLKTIIIHFCIHNLFIFVLCKLLITLFDK